MFCNGSPYSPFFTSGLLLSQSDYTEQLKSFLSFDAESSSLPPARPDSPRFLPAARPEPSATLPSPPTTISRTSSTASTRYRRVKRTDALARLEGKHIRPPLAVIPQHDFMSLSDDEGDDEMSDSSNESDTESFIELPPPVLRRHAHTASSPSILTNSAPSFFSSQSRIRSTKSRRVSMSSRRTSSLPLRSFIDLKDEDTWRWRSFIEISVA